MMLRVLLMVLAIIPFAVPLPAAATRIVPRCDLPMKDAKGRFDWGFGPNVGESKAADRYEQMLISSGVDAHLTRFFSGCLQTWVEVDGKDKMKFYDPETLEEIPLDR
ncbi:MAG: hypothetical protein ABI697_08950 [Devosia sp.]